MGFGPLEIYRVRLDLERLRKPKLGSIGGGASGYRRAVPTFRVQGSGFRV